MADTHGFFKEYLPGKIEKNPDLAKSINAVFQFDIAGAGTWSLDMTSGAGVTEGPHASPNCVITCDKATWEEILDKPSKAVQLVMMGRLKVSNLGLATKLQQILA